MSYIGSDQARALLGAWQEIVGWQEAGRHSNIHHGPYGGHRHRDHRQHAGHGAGYGGPSYGPPPGYIAYPTPGYPAEVYPTQVYSVPEIYPAEMYPAEVYPTQGYPSSRYPAPGYAGASAGPSVVERQGSLRADRITLPMSSGVAILPNTSAQITSRPQNVAFRPERIIIGGRPGDWIVNDIKVGNRSQFSQSGDVPGEMFAATTIDAYVSMETVQTAMDFVMLVTFIGDTEGGSQFVCGVLGTAAV
jgi:hypothetical protein